MINYKYITNFERNNKYYNELIYLLKDFWDTLSKIDKFKILQVTDEFEVDYYQFIKMLMEYNNGVLVLALDNNNPIGFALGYIWNKPQNLVSLQKDTIRAELYDLYVKEDYRNKGIGTTLIRWFENYYKDFGCSHFVIAVLSSNKNAHKLYKTAGYKDNVIEMMKEIK